MEVTLVPVASETLKVASLRDETAGKLPCSSTLEWAGHVRYCYGYICKQPSAYAAHSTLQSCANGVSWLHFKHSLVFPLRFHCPFLHHSGEGCRHLTVSFTSHVLACSHPTETLHFLPSLGRQCNTCVVHSVSASPSYISDVGSFTHPRV